MNQEKKSILLKDNFLRSVIDASARGSLPNSKVVEIKLRGRLLEDISDVAAAYGLAPSTLIRGILERAILDNKKLPDVGQTDRISVAISTELEHA